MEQQESSSSTLVIKQESIETPIIKTEKQPIQVIDLGSDSDSSSSSDKRRRVTNGENGSNKKQKRVDDALEYVLPLGFLDPLPQDAPPPAPLHLPDPNPVRHYRAVAQSSGCKQFWKAGDYEDSSPVAVGSSSSTTVGMDHVRVHPKFLHSNATSHKWALGAFAELLDNSLDEVISGATFVNVDVIENKKDGSRMLLIEDNGGGMDPDKMRQCMSLGYSAKSKMANVIGQYGNGFKTSTMRLGADVIVFSRSRGKDGKRSTQSIGMLSYTFLRSTAKEDIVVPMVDFEKDGLEWNKLPRSSLGDWSINLETIVQWSPYSSEGDLFQQFATMNDQGTRIIIYNLWEDDQGELELDFDTNREDINLRGVNRDEKKIEMAKQFPNSRHFLTYRHSLRSYVSILYLRRSRFRIVLRGKDVEHHNIVNDMMLSKDIIYKPTGSGAEGIAKDTNMVVVTIGFVKDAKDHIDVQGYNVYHKNRLIKPFWRVWNAAGSDGRGVIGVLEANFIEPAHDKQGFERTTVLSRLEQRLIQMQKTYWSSFCHKIGYAPRRQKKQVAAEAAAASREMSSEYSPHKSSRSTSANKDRNDSQKRFYGKGDNGIEKRAKYSSKSSSSDQAFSAEEDSDSELATVRSGRPPISNSYKDSPSQRSFQREDGSHIRHSAPPNSCHSEIRQNLASNGAGDRVTRSQVKVGTPACNGNGHIPVSDALGLDLLRIENSELKDRLKKLEESLRDLELERDKNKAMQGLGNGVSDLDTRDQNLLRMENQMLKNSLKETEESYSQRCESLETQLKELEQRNEEMNKEQEALIDIFSEERSRRDGEEDNLRKKLKDASNTIQQLLDKVRELEKLKPQTCKTEP